MNDSTPHRFSLEDLTICLPTVGRPGYLEAALRSLLDTTPPGPALHVVLNAAPEEAHRAVEPLVAAWPGPSRISVVEERLGIADSHNVGLSATETPLVTFMGDDDLVLEERLPDLLAWFDLDPQPLVVASYAHRMGGPPGRPELLGHKDLGPRSIEEWRRWRDQNRIFELVAPTAIIDTAAARDIGGWDPNVGVPIDITLFTKLAQRGPVLTHPNRGFAYRVHEASVTTSNWFELRRSIRYVRACIDADRAGRPEPTWDEFAAAEAAAGRWQRFRWRRRDRAMLEFRRGGTAWVNGQRAAGLGHMALSVVNHPPTFVEKVADQFGRRYGSN